MAFSIHKNERRRLCNFQYPNKLNHASVIIKINSLAYSTVTVNMEKKPAISTKEKKYNNTSAIQQYFWTP